MELNCNHAAHTQVLSEFEGDQVAWVSKVGSGGVPWSFSHCWLTGYAKKCGVLESVSYKVALILCVHHDRPLVISAFMPHVHEVA